MISVGEALERLLAEAPATEEELVRLEDLRRRTLSRDVVAGFDWPIEPRSTMDGIAVGPKADAFGSLRLIGEASAGTPFDGELKEDTAIRVATGAVVPKGADRVVPIEQVEIVGTQARLVGGGEDRFIRARGSDFREGDVLLQAGRVLNAGAIALVAAANQPDVWVRGRPRVTIISCGDELVAPGTDLGPGQTVDSARLAIAALATDWGADVATVPRLPDEPAPTESALRSALRTSDLVVSIGGASVGARDYLRPAARALGMEFAFEKVAVQPGKPCWHARSPDGMILGLPGNPASAVVCAHLFLRPLLDAMLGRPSIPFSTARLAEGASAGEREQYLRGRVTDRDGAAWVELAPDQDSGLQSFLAWADCLVRIRPNSVRRPGDKVEILLIGA